MIINSTDESGSVPLSGDDPFFFKKKFSESINNLMTKTYDIYKEDDLKIITETIDIWINVSEKNLRVYSLITEKILKGEMFEEEDEDITVLVENIKIIDSLGTKKCKNPIAWRTFIEKILDHIDLAQHQQNIFSKQISQVKKQNKLLITIAQETISRVKSVREESENLELRISEVNQNYDDIKIQNEKLVEKQEKVQKDFISILGIFAAILLASFGGLTIISNILDNVAAPLGKIMMLGSLALFSVLTITFLLLNGISKLTGQQLRNCHCKKGEACTCSLPQKHPTIYKSFILVVITFVLGSFELLINFDEVRANVGLSGTIGTMVFVILVILASAYYYDIHSGKKKETNN